MFQALSAASGVAVNRILKREVGALRHQGRRFRTGDDATPRRGYTRGMLKRDYLERLTRRLAEAVAKMLGLVKSGLGEEAEALLDEVYATHLGLPHGLLASLDDASKRRVLEGRPEIAVHLLRAESELRLAQGREAEARSALELADKLEDSTG